MQSQTNRGDGLKTPVQFIKGIGPKRAATLDSLGIRTVHDLLYYFPRRYLDLSRVEKIGALTSLINSDEWVSVVGQVRSFQLMGRRFKQRFEMTLGDETGTIQLTFFQNAHYFKTAFQIGDTLAVSGRVTAFRNRPQMIHPAIDRLSGDKEEGDDKDQYLKTAGIISQYSSSEELRIVHLDSKGIRRIMKNALDMYLHELDDFLPSTIGKANNLIALRDAIKQIHFPGSDSELENARYRLKFDELFILQVLLALRRKHSTVDLPGIAFNVESKLARKLVDSLPFTLTKAQVKVIKDIAGDMKSARPMNRLLQGDVGSGKTIVAAVSMLIAIDNGYQAAFMAPTEILAEQHFHTLAKLFKDLPVNVRLLVSGQKKRLRTDILEDIQRGSAQLVVGTHALIQEGVEFGKLGMVVIDEQHRFGVMQRSILKEKGVVSHNGRLYPDVLVMTATPIPRTLSLTIYGDLDVSVIDELPRHRKPIKTVIRTESQQQSVYDFIRSEIISGRQVYIVYPLVEESEKLDLKAATESYEFLRTKVFIDCKVGLLHGRMAPEEKDSIMEEFKSKKLDILVATTVVEVGIDVPNASVMIIEHAERFGLSQLHQLRGRVGRGVEQSYCILMAPDWLGSKVRRISSLNEDDDEQDRMIVERRLSTMLKTTDGFKIAEIDLELRGPGDFFGTRQSGMPELQIANLITDGEILTLARKEAFALIDRDPHLDLAADQPLKKYFNERLTGARTLIEVS
ncbi:MAG: ATP-dependent DNA helicase RecG [Bacteroidota bacterium]